MYVYIYMYIYIYIYIHTRIYAQFSKSGSRFESCQIGCRTGYVGDLQRGTISENYPPYRGLKHQNRGSLNGL